MLTKTNVVYQSDGAGAGGETNPPASPSAGTTVAVDAKTLSELVNTVKTLKGEIGGIYSRQDKDRNAFREFMDEYQKQKANNLSDTEAFTATENAIKQRAEAMEEKELLRKIADKVLGSPSTQAAGNGASGASVEAAAELEKYGLAKDPDALELIRVNAPKDKVKDFILEKLAPKQPPSPAGLTQSAALTSAQKTNADSLSREFDAENAKIPRGSAGMNARAALKARIRQKAREAGFTINI
jgi:hypothetical protein